MAIEAWLPIGHPLPDGARTRMVLHAGAAWQITEIQDGGRALIAEDELARRWIASGLVDATAIAAFDFGLRRLWSITSGAGQTLRPVADGGPPRAKADALAFARAIKTTRETDRDSPLHDAVYVEKIGRLLPSYRGPGPDDDAVLGTWLSGGANVSATSFQTLGKTLSWLETPHLNEIVAAAGLPAADATPDERRGHEPERHDEPTGASARKPETSLAERDLELPGRPALEAFFNEHVVDIVRNRERYRALGIGFPPPIVLHGPPGCGKTFAVERLVAFLDWPSFQIDASSVASAYIHETSKKVAEVFERAIRNGPSVLVIDEMEAYLADREMGPGHHRVEEVAEFLRRIPEAAKNDVLVVAMTNRVDLIDPAILRRGRFDHIVEVDFASEADVLALLEHILHPLPKEDDVDTALLAKRLAYRPLSDVAFVVREGARLAARAGRDRLDHASLMAALEATPARDGGSRRPVGFA